MNSHRGEVHLEVDSARYGNWTRFCNSHCDPNVEVCPEQAGGIRILVFRAIKDIDENEEVTINYGREYFQDRDPELMCTCNFLPHPHPNRGTEEERAADARARKGTAHFDQPFSKKSAPSVAKASKTPHIPHFYQPFSRKEAPSATKASKTPRFPHFYQPLSRKEAPSYVRTPRRQNRQASRGLPYVSAVRDYIQNQEVIDVLGSDSDSSISCIYVLGSESNSSHRSLYDDSDDDDIAYTAIRTVS
ncbi:hypothetical protein B0T21DRAFT_373218 [Apiosordaria backusii]|uniref:SET domain-containing protein n=1 Tax=Apiosordaria backusii TaxID=314023 RepID=A0AA40E3I1_9PEZI|nr:hypothetical protein B0T21DRAFT_373218 [Apiosordaria backusii]